MGRVLTCPGHRYVTIVTQWVAEEYDPSELVCGACSNVSRARVCNHGNTQWGAEEYYPLELVCGACSYVSRAQVSNHGNT